MAVAGLLLIGIVAGALSGLLGVGGATIIIPALLYFFKANQHLAQGTSIAALLLPVGILAALKYYQAGNVNVTFAVIIALGFLIGGLIGGTIAQPLSGDLLRKLFAGYMIIIALQLLFWK
jgi:uncharacterized membrane protein YfcA